MAYKTIQTRSPFYIQMTTANASATLSIYIWNGLQSAKPASPSYELTKEQNDGAVTFEVAELIRDYIHQTANFNTETGYKTNDGQVFVYTSITDGVATQTENYIALEGYHLFHEGLKHNSNAEVLQGIGLPEEGVRTFRYLLPEDTAGQLPKFLYTATVEPTDNSLDRVRYQDISAVDTQYQVTDNALTYTVIIDRFGCSKFDVAKLTFLNKKGVKQDFYFTMKSTETLQSSSDTFKRSLSDFSNLSGGEGLHSHRKRLLGSKQSFVLNTDWISEYYVKQIEELFLSEYVWLTYNDISFPVNIDDSSIDKKKHVNEKLIQYSMNVTTAANYLNQVR